MIILRKISAIIMAMFILLTTVGFALHSHHCNIKKETITSVAHARDCCGTSDQKACPKDCCQDETLYIQIDVETSLPASAHEFTPEQIVAVLLHCILNTLFCQEEKVSAKYLNYRPPLLLQDIPVLVQSFLI